MKGATRLSAVFLVTLVIALLLAPTASAAPLHVGDRSGYVATWQATVNRALFAAASVEKKPFTPIVVDGVFGPLTKHATRRFQRVFEAPVTGTVGPSSWIAWYESSLTSACTFGTPPTVEGEVASCVGWWQLTVNKWLAKHQPHEAPLVPDGVFGPLTLAATVSFQAASGLVAEGVVGPHTWNSAAAQELI
jgi:peptidoglycan hydrolase-like protein with peptidoglycan-binding domain